MKIVTGVLLATMALPLLAAQPAAKPNETLISSNELEMNFKPKRFFIYTGKVKVVDPEINLFCEKMTVTFGKAIKQKGVGPAPAVLPLLLPKLSPDKPKQPMFAQGGQIQVIVAEKNVVIVNKEDKTRATGKRGVFTAATNLLVLTGDPVLFRDGVVVRGEVITWNRLTGKMIVSKAEVNIRGEDKKKPAPKPAPKR